MVQCIDQLLAEQIESGCENNERAGPAWSWNDRFLEIYGIQVVLDIPSDMSGNDLVELRRARRRRLPLRNRRRACLLLRRRRRRIRRMGDRRPPKMLPAQRRDDRDPRGLHRAAQAVAEAWDRRCSSSNRARQRSGSGCRSKNIEDGRYIFRCRCVFERFRASPAITSSAGAPRYLPAGNRQEHQGRGRGGAERAARLSPQRTSSSERGDEKRHLLQPRALRPYEKQRSRSSCINLFHDVYDWLVAVARTGRARRSSSNSWSTHCTFSLIVERVKRWMPHARQLERRDHPPTAAARMPRPDCCGTSIRAEPS